MGAVESPLNHQQAYTAHRLPFWSSADEGRDRYTDVKTYEDGILVTHSDTKTGGAVTLPWSVVLALARHRDYAQATLDAQRDVGAARARSAARGKAIRLAKAEDAAREGTRHSDELARHTEARRAMEG